MPRKKRSERKVIRSKNPIKVDDPRNYTIRKGSELIQEGRFMLTKNEFKALNFIIGLVKPKDTAGTVYSFDCRKFLNTLGYKANSDLNEARFIIQSLASHKWWIKDKESDKWKLAGWIDLAETDSDSRVMNFTFHQTVTPFLFDLDNPDNHKFITRYKYGYINQMQKEYSPRLYELLKSYANNDEWIFEFNTQTEKDICIILAKTELDQKTKKKTVFIPKNWSRFSQFKRDVLDPAKEEINKYSDILIDYEPLKYDLSGNKHRGTAAIKFSITSAGKRETESDIEDTDTIEEPKQMSFEDVFPEVAQNEQQKHMDEYRKAKEAAIDNSAYPNVMELLYGDVTETQIAVLIESLSERLVPGRIPKRFLDAWACDVINHYWRKIKATPERTKSSPFLRLMSDLTFDNDGKILERSQWEREV
ncbi:Protein involved in initiation of plasmid replication [Oribacterium sp. KHPX15]|uniref:replication initiation protein n=1 Tax=Oribacterium sp. KHPX15 TaxID=1855342 RepID=UPI00089B1DBB|nr:replication initiation protein [Oribacterium sp. KHPX15]SEA83890.1 Protein involved in initiation of plasmid replication [Oribacterium sp. KHPX15]